MGLSGNYQLWLSDRDERGEPIDSAVLNAAYTIGEGFFWYRRSDLQCESLANTLAEAAVADTSRVHRRRSLENLQGYLFTSFRRRVNKYLSRQSRVQAVGRGALEGLANGQETCFAAVERLEDRVRLREFMAALDPETRDIFAARIAGYSVTEIAQQMGIDRNCLGMRYMRGLLRAEK